MKRRDESNKMNCWKLTVNHQQKRIFMTHKNLETFSLETKHWPVPIRYDELKQFTSTLLRWKLCLYNISLRTTNWDSQIDNLPSGRAAETQLLWENGFPDELDEKIKEESKSELEKIWFKSIKSLIVLLDAVALHQQSYKKLPGSSFRNCSLCNRLQLAHKCIAPLLC